MPNKSSASSSHSSSRGGSKRGRKKSSSKKRTNKQTRQSSAEGSGYGRSSSSRYGLSSSASQSGWGNQRGRSQQEGRGRSSQREYASQGRYAYDGEHGRRGRPPSQWQRGDDNEMEYYGYGRRPASRERDYGRGNWRQGDYGQSGRNAGTRQDYSEEYDPNDNSLRQTRRYEERGQYERRPSRYR